MPIKNNLSTYAFTLLVLSIFCYLVLSYFFMTFCQTSNVDFHTFYSSLTLHQNHQSAYQPLNLNPPIFLYIFRWLTIFDYETAKLIWGVMSIVLFFIQAKLVLNIVDKQKQFKHIEPYYYLCFFCSYPVLMHTLVGQVSGLIGFLLVLGYQLERKNKLIAACLIWGLAASLKLFPLLLMFYLLSKKKYQETLIFIGVFILLSAMPLLFEEYAIYQQYFTLLKNIIWYQNSWNLSLFGLPFKLFWLHKKSAALFYMLAFIASLLCLYGFWLYLVFLNKTGSNHFKEYKFNLSLIFMILLSPLGWLYYLPLMLMPFASTLLSLNQRAENVYLWLLSYFLILFPTPNILQSHLHFTTWQVLLFLCLNTLGLILLVILNLRLINTTPITYSNTLFFSNHQKRLFIIVSIILAAIGTYSIITYLPAFLAKHCHIKPPT